MHLICKASVYKLFSELFLATSCLLYTDTVFKGLEASQLFQDIVTSGYCLLILAYPPAVCAINHESALENAPLYPTQSKRWWRLGVQLKCLFVQQFVAHFKWL